MFPRFLAEPLYDRCLALPDADAKSRQPIFDISTQTHLVDESRHQPRARATKRMPDRDRAAIDVDDLRIEVQVFHHRQGLNGKGFVQFHESNVFHL